MEFKTKFNIGDTVVTVKDCSPIEVTVGAVLITKDGVYYGASPVEAALNPIKEDCCFTSKEELIKHISDKQTAKSI